MDVDLSKFVINEKDFEIGKSIGRGSYATVYAARRFNQKKIYALKKFHSNFTSKSVRKMFIREVTVMAKLQHPCVLGLRGYYMPEPTSTEVPIILTDYMKNGDLFSILLKKGKGKGPITFTITKALINAFGIAAGMAYFHRSGGIHRDLKPANIMLDESFEPHVADFGLAKIAEDATMSMIGGSPYWMAPELFMETQYDNKVDVYAYGILLYQLLTGILPFGGKLGTVQLGQRITRGDRPEIPPTLPQFYADVVQACWNQDPSLRPTFDQIVEHLASATVFLPGTNVQEYKDYQRKILQWAPPGEAPLTDPFKSGMVLMESGKYLEAIERFKKAEQSGNVDAAYQLGMMVLEGRGVQPDARAAAHFFKKAADAGHEEAQMQCARMLYKGTGVAPNKALACDYYRLAAKNGSIEAMVVVAKMLAYGDGVVPDQNRALGLLQYAADKGSSEAEFELGLLQQKLGKASEGMQHIQRAAQMGNAAAALKLSELHKELSAASVQMERREFERNTSVELFSVHGGQSPIGSSNPFPVFPAPPPPGEGISSFHASQNGQLSFDIFAAANPAPIDAQRNSFDLMVQGKSGPNTEDIFAPPSPLSQDQFDIFSQPKPKPNPNKQPQKASPCDAFDLIVNGGSTPHTADIFAATERPSSPANAFDMLEANQPVQPDAFDLIASSQKSASFDIQQHQAQPIFFDGASASTKQAQPGMAVDMSKHGPPSPEAESLTMQAQRLLEAGEARKAGAMFRRAADQGSAEAAYQCGLLLLRGGEGVKKDTTKAAMFLCRAATAGHPRAALECSQLLVDGAGVSPDAHKAAFFCKIAADAGDADGLYAFGVMLAQGKGVPLSADLSKEFLRAAATRGHAQAQLLFAYESERTGDFASALRFYRLAADQHNEDAMCNLGMMLEHGRGVPPDAAGAAALYRKAALAGSTLGIFNYAVMLQSGRGTERDIASAARFYEMAAGRGDADACVNLAALLTEGREIPADAPKAAHYAKIGADGGNTRAAFMYGRFLFEGRGVPMNKEEGARYIRSAASQNYERAIRYMKQNRIL